MSANWTDEYLTSRNGLRLHYRDYPGRPDRPAMLCLHGLTRNARDFERFAARYAGERRVIVPDFRGRGQSERDPAPEHYAPPFYAGDVLQLLDALGLSRCIFVGTSLGGLVTMSVASMAPERIAGAVLNDVGPELNPAGLQRIAGYVGRMARFASWDEAADRIAATNAPAHPAYEPADWLEMARRLCVETSDGIVFDYDPAIAVNFKAARDAPAFDAWPVFRCLRGAPLVVLRGSLSDLLSAEVAQRMVAEHDNAQFVTVPGVGHAPDLSEPEALAAVDLLLNPQR